MEFENEACKTPSGAIYLIYRILRTMCVKKVYFSMAFQQDADVVLVQAVVLIGAETIRSNNVSKQCDCLCNMNSMRAMRGHAILYFFLNNYYKI